MRGGPNAAPQVHRAPALAPHRGRAHEGSDPRALPQRDLSRQRDVRRRGREPRPVRQERVEGHDRRRRRARRAAEGAVRVHAARSPGPRAPSPQPRARRSWRRRAISRPGEAATASRQRLVVAENEWRPNTGNEPLRARRGARVRRLGPPRCAARSGDVTVYTTLDLNAQQAADRAVRRQAAAVSRETQYSGGRVTEPAQGALVAMDPRTGDIRALVGGRRSKRGSFNRAFRARRQPGSAFKPFVYAAALAAGITPAIARRRRAGGGDAGPHGLAPGELRGDVHRHASRSRRRWPCRRTPPRCA